jgi:PAS domain S-box-containing protein
VYRVLFVDDEAPFLKSGKTFLEKDGEFSIDTCSSVAAALPQLTPGSHDAIICGHRMPALDGIAFLKEVRESGTTIPFILCTGSSNEDMVIRALNEGASGYFRKRADEALIFSTLAEKVRGTVAVHQKSEEALRESEIFSRSIVENITDYLVIYDRSGRILYTNPPFPEKFGFKPDELIGTPVIQHIAPGYRDRILLMMKERIADRVIPPYEISILRKDGSEVPVMVKATPMRYHNQDAVLVLMFDITDFKRIERELIDSEGRFRVLVDESSDPLFSFTPEGTYTYVNHALAKAFGKNPGELIGMGIGDFFPPEEAKKRFSVLGLVFRTGETLSVEGPVKTTAGTRHYVTTINPIRDKGGRVISAVCSSKDISERRTAEQALEQANHKLKLLQSITRHDINNQLMILGGYIGQVERMVPEASLGEEFARINTAIQRIAAIVLFTREYDEVGINAPLWQDCHSLIGIAARQTTLGTIRLHNDIKAGSEVWADPMISRVFYNLLDNAVRYGGKISTIRFSEEERDGGHLIICEDDGEGVSITDKEQIFKRGAGRNTGMGLTLSREILEITGITIRETGEKGRGARFEITVPEECYRFRAEKQAP